MRLGAPLNKCWDGLPMRRSTTWHDMFRTMKCFIWREPLSDSLNLGFFCTKGDTFDDSSNSNLSFCESIVLNKMCCLAKSWWSQNDLRALSETALSVMGDVWSTQRKADNNYQNKTICVCRVRWLQVWWEPFGQLTQRKTCNNHQKIHPLQGGVSLLHLKNHLKLLLS